MIKKIIERYVQLTRDGQYYVGKSPFSDSELPLLVVDEDTDTFTDISTGISGDSVSFIEHLKGVSYDTAQKMINNTKVETEETEQEKVLKSICRDAQEYFRHNMTLKFAQAAVEYLKKRSFSEEDIEKYGFGYAGKYGDKLYKYLLNKYEKEDILLTGLCKLKDNQPVDLFWNRVMIPIKNAEGEIVAFGGRVLDDGTPKYINSPESPIFRKRELLYGYHIAKDIKCSAYIICEGYMDTISLHKAGFTNAVASLGTALTKNQCELLTNKKRVYVLYDSDTAGVNASLKAIPMLEKIGLETIVVDYSPYKDPDEFIKAEGAEVFYQRVKETKRKGEGFVVEKLIEKNIKDAIAYLSNKSVTKIKEVTLCIK